VDETVLRSGIKNKHLFYQALKQKCEVALSSRIENGNCVELLALADMHSCPQLKRSAVLYIKRSKYPLVRSPTWSARVGSVTKQLQELLELVML
jgi:hypothetical protein